MPRKARKRPVDISERRAYDTSCQIRFRLVLSRCRRSKDRVFWRKSIAVYRYIVSGDYIVDEPWIEGEAGKRSCGECFFLAKPFFLIGHRAEISQRRVHSAVVVELDDTTPTNSANGRSCIPFIPGGDAWCGCARRGSGRVGTFSAARSVGKTAIAGGTCRPGCSIAPFAVW